MADAAAIVGTGSFLALSGALVYAGALAGVVKEALRPDRKTVGWALGRGYPVEPNAWGLPGREWAFAYRGSTCPVFDVGSADPAAPTIVVLHGFARSRYDALARLGPMLSYAGRFLCPDLPGHGDAAGRGTRLGTDEDKFLAAFVAASTTGPVTLVGHSLGATIALHAACDPSIAARVEGVLAFAPYESLRTPLGARLDLRALPRSPFVGPAMALLSAFGIRERSSRLAAAGIRCPLAVIAGEHDPVSPVDESRRIAEAAPRSRIALVRHGRHDDFHTLGQSEVASALGWLAACGRQAQEASVAQG